MTVVYCDGFDTYTSFASRYSVIGAQFTLNTTNQRSGIGCVAIGSASGSDGLKRILPTAAAHPTMIAQFAFYRAVVPSQQIIAGVTFFSGNGNTPQTSVAVRNDGTVQAFRSSLSGGTSLGITSSPHIAGLGVWAYIGFKTTLADTGATVQIWVNDNLALTLTNQDTRNSGSDVNYDAFQLMAASISGSPVAYVDDLLIMNGAGSVNNNYIGDKQVLPRLVNGAGDRTQLTPYGQATNWQNVDEVRADGVEYNGSATVGNGDLYTMQDITAGASISYVQQVTVAGKNEVGTKSIAPIIKSGGTEYPQTAVALTQAFQPLINGYENDPATGAAWTPAGFNACQMGAEVRA